MMYFKLYTYYNLTLTLCSYIGYIINNVPNVMSNDDWVIIVL